MTQEQERIIAGLQCPECWSANINPRHERVYADRVVGFQCQDCGCQWTKRNPTVSKDYR